MESQTETQSLDGTDYDAEIIAESGGVHAVQVVHGPVGAHLLNLLCIGIEHVCAVKLFAPFRTYGVACAYYIEVHTPVHLVGEVTAECDVIVVARAGFPYIIMSAATCTIAELTLPVGLFGITFGIDQI